MKLTFRILTAAACLMALTTTAMANAASHDMHKAQEATSGKPGNAKDVDRTITIEASEIAFNVKDITVKAGETIRFVLINKGNQPHELAIGSSDEMAKHRQMMIDMAGMDMGDMQHEDKNMISTEPGETKELIWQFAKAGTFEFACNYPGHSELGMMGPLTVE